VLQALTAEGFNPATLEAAGQLVCCEAEKLLSRFMLDGSLDELEFKTTIGDLIQKAKQGGCARSVRVFGEMVALIWTQRMEELWNHIISSLPMNLMACHSHALS
jgi:hypothetical protein